METLKRHWYNLPTSVRKPLVLVIGLLFVIASALTGWLPGPGGLPLFLIGIAILATEFEWAMRLRDWVVGQLQQAGHAFRRHKVAGTIIMLVAIAAIISLSVLFYRWLY